MSRLIASLPDVARYDASAAPLPLDWVGMQGIDVPLMLAGESANALHARADIAVNLPSPHAKGIHMSRLYRLLDAFAEQETANAATLTRLLQQMVDSHADCHADAARIALSFSLLAKRPALATPGLAGWKSYPCRLEAVRQSEHVQVTLETHVAYSSTCPCSAALSRQAIQDAFGHRFTGDTVRRQDALDWIALHASLATPHSQRSEAVIRITLDPQSGVLPLNELIHRAEIALGTPLQTAVKRADEQVFALLNGSNLMYVEDAARKLQQALQAHFGATSVSVRHMESLHPHDAVASVSSLAAWRAAPHLQRGVDRQSAVSCAFPLSCTHVHMMMSELLPSVLPRHQFASLQPGPRLLILGAVHGNETCGTRAIERLLRELQDGSLTITRGLLTLVPVTNPLAYQKKQRQGDRNLNRNMQVNATPANFEDRIANVLCPWIAEHDVLLDLHSFHTGGVPFAMLGPEDNQSDIEPFNHAAAEQAMAAHLGTTRIVEGWMGTYARGVERRRQEGKVSAPDLLDRNYGVGTTEYARTQNAYGITLECGQHDDPKAPDVAYYAIRQTLALLGMADIALQPPQPDIEIIRLVDVIDMEHADDRFTREWASFDRVAKGDVIGHRHNGQAVTAVDDGYIVFPNPKAIAGNEWFYFGVKSDRKL